MSRLRGRDHFGHRLHPGVLQDIDGWTADPELGKLVNRLDSMADGQEFLDAYAEVAVARRLVQHGCAIRVEVPAQGGRTADFEASSGTSRFYVHVKRLNTDARTQKQMNLMKRLKVLERIDRPLLVGITLERDLNDVQMQALVAEAKDFIRTGVPGSRRQFEQGGRIIAEGTVITSKASGQVSLLEMAPIGYPSDELRFFRLLRKAYQQFVPDALNVVAITSPWPDDHENVEAALSGLGYDTWEPALPEYGFWSGGRHDASQVAAFFSCPYDTDVFLSWLWLRPGAAIDPVTLRLLRRVFDSTSVPDKKRGGSG